MKELIDDTTLRTNILLSNPSYERDTYDAINHFIHVDKDSFGIDAVIVNQPYFGNVVLFPKLTGGSLDFDNRIVLNKTCYSIRYVTYRAD